MQDLEDAGAEPELKVRALQDQADRASSGLSVFRYLMTPEGAFDAIGVSMRRMNGGSLKTEDIDPVIAAELGCLLCNIELKRDKDEGSEDEEQEDE